MIMMVMTAMMRIKMVLLGAFLLSRGWEGQQDYAMLMLVIMVPLWFDASDADDEQPKV